MNTFGSQFTSIRNITTQTMLSHTEH